jgi:hypothetical protein
MTDLYAKTTDGALFPLAECKWVRFAPNGCASSSATGDTATTPEGAHTFFVPRQRDRDRETRNGWTVELLSRKQWNERASACFYGECAHRFEKDGAH